MKTRPRRTVAALVACLGLLGIFAVAVTVARAPDDKALAQGLRSGGFVIVVRHGPTFADIEDSDLLNLDSNAAQLNLNDEGETLARAFGRAMHDAYRQSAKADTRPLAEIPQQPTPRPH